MSTFLDNRNYWVTPLSPLHLGSGQELDWTSTVQDGQSLIVFDPITVRFGRDALREIERVLQNLDDAGLALLNLRKIYIANLRPLRQSAMFRLGMFPYLAAQLERVGETVSQRQPRIGVRGSSIIDQMVIARTAASGVAYQPYLPGSGLKGALRTSWLDTLPVELNSRKSGGPGLDEETMLKGSFASDPFRLLKISDARPSQEATTLVMKAWNVKRRGGAAVKERGVEVRVEAVTPFLPKAFAGEISRLELEGRSTRREQGTPPVAAPAWDKLVAAVNVFHRRLFDEQAAELAQLEPVNQAWLKQMVRLLQRLDAEIKAGRLMLVRLGKFATAESKTVSQRQIRIRQGKERSERKSDHGTTFWLGGDEDSQQGLPFGWALMGFDDIESEPVSEFCQAMRRWLPQVAPAPIEEPSGPASGGGKQASPPPRAPELPRIVAAPANEFQQRLAELERSLDDASPEKQFRLNQGPGQLLRNLINQSKRSGIVAEDKHLLARLVEEKAGKRLRLNGGETQQLEKDLAWLKK
jgi:CRISPR-associated protein Csm5